MSSPIRSTLQSRKIRTAVGKHNINTKAPSKTDQIAEAAYKIAREQLIPQANQRQKNAIKGDRRLINFYFKKVSGRPCSCVGDNSAPSGSCHICYKTGIVGGFDKYGTHTEVLDFTATNVSVNIRGAFQQRPTIFILDPECLSGAIIFEFEVKQNIGKLDLLQKVGWASEGSFIKYSIWSGTNWLTLDEENLQSFLTNSKIKIKVELTRISLLHKSPEFNHIKVRYNHEEQTFLNSDWPPSKNSRALSEFGIYTAWQTSSFNLDNTLPFVNPEDWVYRSDRNEKWKIIETVRHDPEELILGHEVTGRLIQKHEIYEFFPL